MSAKPLVEIRGLSKSFLHMGHPLRILKGIDLTIYEGDMISVVGMSGAGKSTFLQILGTLDVPSAGRVIFDGIDVFGLSPEQLSLFRNRSIGFIFQFHHLLPEFNALENAAMPCLIARMPRKEAYARAEELLIEVGLKERLRHRPSELSGGEQQRVALARALVMNPRLVLADEPTGNLDSRTSAEVHELFFRLNRERGIAMMLVTHNPLLAQIARRQLQMIDGRIQEAPQPSSLSPSYREEPPESSSLSPGLVSGPRVSVSLPLDAPAEPTPGEISAPPEAPAGPSEPERPADAAPAQPSPPGEGDHA